MPSPDLTRRTVLPAPLLAMTELMTSSLKPTVQVWAVWVETAGAYPLHRLMVAQDIGSAIKSPWRADVFVGTGHHAGEVAGGMKDNGRMVVLLPCPPFTEVAGRPR